MKNNNDPCKLTLESIRFYDEDDYKNEIFPIVSSAHTCANVNVAGKCDSHRHSTTSFSANVVVTKTGYQILGILSLAVGRGL